MGSSSRVRPSPRVSFVSAARRGRKSATAAAMTRTSAGWSITASMTAVAHLGGRLGADDGGAVGQRDLDAARDDRHARPAGEGRLGDRDAHPAGAAVADEPDGVDGLRGPAGADDDVAALEVRLDPGPGRRRSLRGVRAGGPGGPRRPRRPRPRSAAGPRAARCRTGRTRATRSPGGTIR